MTERSRTRAERFLAENSSAILFGVVLVLVWEGTTRALNLPLSIYPPPTLVLWSFFIRLDLLMDHAWLTFYQTILGFFIAVVAGISIGWAISKSDALYTAFYPVIVMLQVIPKEALAPLLVLWFGAGVLSRMILAFLIAFFPMVINTIIGVRGIDQNMRRYARALSCNLWQQFFKIEAPSALSSIFAGLKISVTLAVIGVVVAEIVAGRGGLGYLLLFASSRLDMGFSLAILLVLALWGGLLFGLIVLLERKAIFWRR